MVVDRLTLRREPTTPPATTNPPDRLQVVDGGLGYERLKLLRQLKD